MASTSSTPFQSVRKKEYDVFLSFRGTDTRKTFVDHLYKELQQKGIRTFKDDEGLEKGARIEKLLKIIKESEFAVVVFSKDYASAKWCLEEIATIMDCQQQYGKEIMIPIFYDVEPSVVRNQTESFGESFKRHEEENTEKAKVERWKEALKKAGQISGYHLQNEFNGFEAKCVETVTTDIFTRVNRSIQASSTVLGNFMGLESRLTDVGKLLTQEPDAVQFIGIWGMGGIGKTTIAMVIFNKFSSQFDGACFHGDVKEHKITELQENLLKTILKAEKMEISNEVDGMEKIEERLGGKKVLIVLDDVDNVEQLQKLAGSQDWFGKGSRVIITTRDAGVLRSHGVDKKYVYEVPTLEHWKAIQLFSCYAFKSKIPTSGFERLSGLIVHYCKGLPLALKILGSSLRGLEAADWESTLEELKGTPNDDIDAKLKISFDKLDSRNKKIFLHIACFFRHEEEKHVKEVLKSCNLLSAMGLCVLIEKSLISVEEGRIEMHDLIQEMGWHIAKEEKPRSRVWKFEEVDDVLCGNLDPKHIECIVSPYICGFRWQNVENISSGFEALKILIGKPSYRRENDNYQLLSSLESIHFTGYPFRSFPTPSSYPSGITKEFNKLTYLNLSSSQDLHETPNFKMMPNLKILYLSKCRYLEKIDPSIGDLQQLVLLDLSKCSHLYNLPTFIRVSSLKFLKLEHCESLKNFPEIQTSMEYVEELNLESIGIEELPSSIGRLRGLTKLRLYDCKNLVCLSDGLGELENLKILELRDCGQLESLPENLGNLSKLEEFRVFGTAIFQLPSSIKQLSSLECLCWGNKHEFGYLPESFSQLPYLKYLDIRDCKKLKELPELPKTLCELYVSSHFAFRKKSSYIDMLAIKYPKLYSVSFSYCCDDYYSFEGKTFLAKGIQFPFYRKTPFSVSYSNYSFYKDKAANSDTLWELFKYQPNKSNRISFNLNPGWYSAQFVGFVVLFVSFQAGIYGPHSYQGFNDGTHHHCLIKVRLSSHTGIEKDLETKCVIAGTTYNYGRTYICLVYLPFSSLWHTSKPMMEANHYSRFEVELLGLEASANWDIDLLYKSPIGAREDMANYHKSDSEYSYTCNEVIGEENVKVGGDPEIHTDGEGSHMKNDFNGFEAKYVHTVVDKIFAQLHQSNLASTVLEKNLVGLDSRVDSIGMLLRMEPDNVQFIGICGMGGIGKTTLAWNVWKRFSSQYEGDCFLADVRRHDIIELQRTLLKTIVKGSEDHISNEYDGMAEIQRWLRRKKVLIVLDDVDNQLEQLYKLARCGDWFGRGSRVIITTRDARVLRSHGVDKKYIYQVDKLEKQEAIQQFRWHAFKQKAKIGVEELCGSVVRYCIRVPLVLEVVGCSLCGLEAAEWERTLEKFKDTPSDDIHGQLKISFNRLDPNIQKIFLHIACFFRHEEEEYVKDVLKSCDVHPDIGMRVLIERSLISVVEGRIEMHDLIQEMGRHIAREEEHRSRAWKSKEVDDVLCGKMDPRHIECIVSPYTCGFRWQKDENISSAFEALKILIGKRSKNEEEEDNNFDRDVKDNYQLPSSLRWLHFPHYPFRSLPTTFHLSSLDTNLSELVGICLRNSYLENCWITKELNKLTYLDLSYSYSLLETPNFNMMPNLRTLYLSHCSTLKEIHPSVGHLEKLVLLEVSNCYNLKKLPTFIQVSSLQFLQLEACSLENFPEIKRSIPLVVDLNLKSIWIKELPPSIRQLCGLTKLRLFDCRNLVHLCDELCELESLKILEITDCGQLKSLPENLGNLSKLEELYISGSDIVQLPSSITHLSSLECLCWSGNREFHDKPLKFVRSVSGLCSLKRLQLCNFKTIDKELPSDLGQCLISLEYLNLYGSVFGYLPESFNQFPHLRYLDIRRCKKLKKLPELPETISELYLDSHFAFGYEPINIDVLAIKYPMLYSVSFSFDDNCHFFILKTFLVEKSIHFPFHRKTPFSVSYSSYSPTEDKDKDIGYAFLRSFKYRCHKSNRISFNFNPRWYSIQFVGFAVYFVSHEAGIWGPHSYQGIDDCTHHCVITAKLSSHNHIKNEDLQTKCVIVRSSYYRGSDYETICFVYLPFSSLWSESKPMMEANDYSRFEVELVDLEASADWGINLLYKSPIGAREHMDDYHWSDSGRLLTTNDIGCLTSLESEIEYLNLGSNNFVFLPACYSQLPSLRYLDISGCEIQEVPELPATIRELYANSNLASESNITKLVTEYPKLYTVSFSSPTASLFPYAYKEVSTVELARKFAHSPFLSTRSSSFIVTYPIGYYSTNRDITIPKWFKYSSHDSNKISISLESSWHKQSFLGFGVCFILNSRDGIWKSCPDGRPFRYGEVIAQLVHKDNEQLLQTNCVIGRLCDEEFDDEFKDSQIICFAYIPFHSLFKNKLNATPPSDYLVFEVAFGDPASNASTDWSCGLLYQNDESLSEAIPVSTPEPGPDKTKLWKLTEIVDRVQCQMISMPECSEAKVMKTITSLPFASTFLAFHPHDNNIIAIGTEESSIYIYDWVHEDLIKLKEHRKPITGLAFSTKLKMLVSADADAQLCVWTTSLWTMRRSVRIQLPGGEVPSGGDTQVMFHADQHHLLVTHETQLAIYDTSKMELIHQWIPCVRISFATYSCNSELIYASFIDGNIGVLDADTLRLKCRIVPSAYLPQNRSEDVYPLVIAAHPQEPNQFVVGLTDESIKVIEPLESQGNWEVSVSSPVDNGKKNGRLVWQVLRGTLATMCLGLFGMGIIRIIQTKTRKSKMKFDGYMADGFRTNRPDVTEKGEPSQP